MRKNIRLISITITVILFFVLNEIMKGAFRTTGGDGFLQSPEAIIFVVVLILCIVSLVVYILLKNKKNKRRIL